MATTSSANLPPAVTFDPTKGISLDGPAWIAAIKSADAAGGLALLGEVLTQAVKLSTADTNRRCAAQFEAGIDARVKVLIGRAYQQGRREAGTGAGLSTDPAAPPGSLTVNLDAETGKLLRELVQRPIIIENNVEVPQRAVKATPQADGSTIIRPIEK